MKTSTKPDVCWEPQEPCGEKFKVGGLQLYSDKFRQYLEDIAFCSILYTSRLKILQKNGKEHISRGATKQFSILQYEKTLKRDGPGRSQLKVKEVPKVLNFFLCMFCICEQKKLWNHLQDTLYAVFKRQHDMDLDSECISCLRHTLPTFQRYRLSFTSNETPLQRPLATFTSNIERTWETHFVVLQEYCDIQWR